MNQYSEGDVVLQQNPARFSARFGDEIQCAHCGATRFIKTEIVTFSTAGVEALHHKEFRCIDCGTRFFPVDSPSFPELPQTVENGEEKELIAPSPRKR